MEGTTQKLFGKNGLTKRYDHRANRVLNHLGYVKPTAERSPKVVLLKELPTLKDYCAMRDTFFTKPYTEVFNDAKEEVEGIRDELQDWYDSLNEGLQSTEKACALEKAVSQLDNAISYLENVEDYEVPEELKKATFICLPSKSRGKYPSRSHRISEAISDLSLVVQYIEDIEQDASVGGESDPENSDYYDIAANLRDACSDLESVEIPGMY